MAGPKERKTMDPDKVQAIVKRELDSALGQDGSKLSIARREALEYYEGEPFGNEIEGRSQVVTRKALETIEWVLPALLRVFTASDKIADIEPLRKEEEEAAEQATTYVSHIFHRDNSGFLILHDWFKDALMQKLGWVKYWWDDQKVRETNTYTGLTREQYDAMLGPDVEVIDEKEYPAPADMVALSPQGGDFNEDAPQPGQPTLYDCTLRVTRSQGRIHIENVPPEEVLVSHRAKRGVMPFTAHRRERTRSDLLEEGYDKACLEELNYDDGPQYNSERVERFMDEDDFPFGSDRADPAMRDIWVEESYIKVDYDGDGIAELCKVVTANNGQVVLTKDGKPDIVEVDNVPLIPACPIIMPHKLVGLSLIDLVKDLQLINSTLVRQTLDNLFLTNNARHLVVDGQTTEDTYDDLLTSRPGGIIRAKSKDAIVPFVTPFVADKAMAVIQYFDEVGEIRTGVSRHNQGLNPDDLNKTATGVSLIQQAAAQRVELIARIFAFSVQELVKGILGLVRKHQQEERIIRVTGEWLTMDPRQWQNEMEVSVSVGLGTGNRDQILQHLDTILQIQERIVALQQGVQGPFVTAKNIFDAVEQLTENAGFKQSFFTDPSAPPPPGPDGQPGQPPQPPPDPKMMAAQHQMQLDQQKAQQDGQIAQQKAQLEAETNHQRLQADLEIAHAKMQAELQLNQQRAMQQMQLEQQKSEHDMELEKVREGFKQQVAMAEIEARKEAGAYTTGPGDR